jgi:hypothetical protein
VPPVPAATLQTQRTERKIDFVMSYDDRADLNLKKTHHLNERLTATIHEGLRLHEDDSLTAQPRLAHQRSTALSPNRLHAFSAQLLGEAINQQKTEVVASTFVLLPRISQTGYKLDKRQNTFPERISLTPSTRCIRPPRHR